MGTLIRNYLGSLLRTLQSLCCSENTIDLNVKDLLCVKTDTKQHTEFNIGTITSNYTKAITFIKSTKTISRKFVLTWCLSQKSRLPFSCINIGSISS